MVISIGTPGAAKSQGVVGVIVLAGVLSVGVALYVATTLNVLIGGGLVAVSSLASVNRASIVWYTWVAFMAGVSAVCPLGRLQLVRNIMVISVHKIRILRHTLDISICYYSEGGYSTMALDYELFDGCPSVDIGEMFFSLRASLRRGSNTLRPHCEHSNPMSAPKRTISHS